MRKIRFRGKILEPLGLLNAGSWIEGGYYVDYCYGGCPEGKHYIVHWNSGGLGFTQLTQVDPETVGQYTGLKDKNGLEICEGDVIEVDANPHYGVFKTKVECYQGVFGYFNIGCRQVTPPVRWDKEYPITSSRWFLGGFSALSGQDYAKHRQCDYKGVLDSVKVIGNIYENPELLKMEEVSHEPAF